MFIPKKDTYNYAKRRMLNQLAGLMGGRIAEEVVLGDITSGASGDIKQATKLARHMVCDWGMSPLGPVAYGDNQDTVFLGREITRNENYSEETARLIDQEVHKVIEEQYQRARSIVIERRSALDKIAEALLEFETIDGKHVHEILDFGELRSPVLGSVLQAQKPEDKGPTKKTSDKAAHQPLGGPSPAPNPA
jgi:cell division protease FtsH